MKNGIKKSLLFYLFTVLLTCISAAVLLGCGGKSDNGKEKPIENEETVIALTEYSISIKTGETYAIEVLNAEGEIEFSSRNVSVATVDGNGTVTGVADGETVIDVECGNDSLELNVTVTESLAEGVDFRLNAVSSQIYVGYELTLTPKITIGRETADNSDYTFTYSSSAEAVATVSDTGKVRGVSAGNATVTASVTINGEEYSSEVSFRVIDLDVVNLSASSVTLSETGDYSTEKLDYEYKKYENGEFVVKDDVVPVWTSSDESVVTVDNGVITGVSAGTATVTVEIGGSDAVCEVKVYDYYAKIYDAAGFLDIDNHLDGYFELINDIDFAETEFLNPIGYVELPEANVKVADYGNNPDHVRTFNGHLDGNGYTVKNITHAVGTGNERFERLIFTKIGADGVVENIGFEIVNGNSTIVCGGGVAGSNLGTIRNVAVDLTISGIGMAYNEWGTAGIANLNFGLVSSCVANIRALNGVTYGSTVCLGGIINVNKGAKMENCLAVVNSAEVGVYSHTGSWGSVSGCAVVTDASEISANFNKALLSSSIWNTTGEVVPTLKNTKETVISAEKIYAGPDGANGVTLDLEGYVVGVRIDGKAVEYTVNGALLEIAPATLAGANREKGTLIVETDEYIRLYTLCYFNKEVIQPLAVVYDRSTGSGATFSVADITDEITEVRIGDTETTFNVSGTDLTIPHASFEGVVGTCTIKVYTEGTLYVYQATVYTAIFGSATTYESFANAVNNELNGYYVLTGDVNLGNINSTTHQGYVVTGEFSGVLDGAGHKITFSSSWVNGSSNHSKSLFETLSASAIVKDLAVNVTFDETNGVRRSAIANTNNGLIENCFVNATYLSPGQGSNDTYGSASVVIVNKGTIDNCVVSVTYTGATAIESKLCAVCMYNSTGTINNVVVYKQTTQVDASTLPFEAWNGGTKTNCQVTTSVSDAIAAVNDGAKFTKGSLWTTDAEGVYYNGTKVIG